MSRLIKRSKGRDSAAITCDFVCTGTFAGPIKKVNMELSILLYSVSIGSSITCSLQIYVLRREKALGDIVW